MPTLFLILKVCCFLSIAFGILSLLALWTPIATSGAGSLLVAPDEALGLIFLGFAVRMSRLEGYRPTVRLIVRTCRACLILIGLSGALGLHMLQLPSRMMGNTSFAASVCYIFVGAELALRGRYKANRFHSAVTAVACVFVGACWISLLLSAFGLSPNPELLVIHPTILTLITANCLTVFALSRTPSVLRVLYQGGPESEAARVLFPFAFLIPVVLAILRNQAESRGWVQPNLGLSFHVLLSASSMALMIVWAANRTHSLDKWRESCVVAASELESQYRDLFSVLRDPVWIFQSNGKLVYRNAAASLFSPPGRSTCLQTVFGLEQDKAIISAALLGNSVAQVDMCERASGTVSRLPVVFLRVFFTPSSDLGLITLIARGSRSPETEAQNVFVSLESDAATDYPV